MKNEKMKKNADVTVVIANWNGLKYLKECFDSLSNQTYDDFKIIFVDNGSDDGSVDFVKTHYPETEIIEFGENTGFARGYNAGIEKALQDENTRYAVVLNNDTNLDPKCMETLVACVKRHPEAASIQPKVLNFFEKRKIDCAGILISSDGVATNRGYGKKDGPKFEEESEIFGANGTASLFTRQALEETQMKPGEYFDNDFFAYYEDTDLAWRMRLAGFNSYFCPQAKIFHIHSATAGKISGFKAYYLNRNRFFVLIKNYPFCRLIGILFILTPIRYALLFFRVIMKKGRKGEEIAGQKKNTVAKEIFRAWGSVAANLPRLIRKRKDVQEKKEVSKKEIRRWFSDFGVKFLDTF